MNVLRKYSEFIAHKPWIVLGIVLMVFFVSFYYSGQVETKDMNYDDMLPDYLDVMKALNYLEDNFGGSDTALIIVETLPQYAGSEEPRDIRDPKIINYLNLLTKMTKEVEDVRDATSAGTIMAAQGTIPQDEVSLHKQIEDNVALTRYINDDYNMALVRISLEGDRDEARLVKELEKMIETTPKPSGITVNIGGRSLEQPIVQKLIAPDMQRTSMFSIIAIIVILLLVFRSIKYGLTPLSVILVGSIGTMGFLGLTGAGISTATSGALSMIMGIGIDFGIQTVSRYNLERKKLKKKESLTKTLEAVFIPMLTTTIAAIIGFRAMTMGQLSFLAELGTIMSYGVVACFLTAMTLVPAILILVDNGKKKKSK